MTHRVTTTRPQFALYRKRSGLSQREASFLLGARHNGNIPRYENSHRVPPLRTALAYATILGVPLPQLFPHLQQKVQKEIAAQIMELQAKLADARRHKRGARRAQRKIEWLKQRHAGITMNDS